MEPPQCSPKWLYDDSPLVQPGAQSPEEKCMGDLAHRLWINPTIIIITIYDVNNYLYENMH